MRLKLLTIYFLYFLCFALRAQNILTVAGNGFGAFAGDGGPATSASLNNPYGICYDPSGNLYIADLINNRIRKVDASGTISTFAGSSSGGFGGDGGPATSASLSGPYAVAFNAGNLYIVDKNNHRIRMVNSSGTISTVAGNGSAGYTGDGGPATSASLNSPNGIAFDASGNMYIADLSNNVIRMVNTSGTISTIAGTGALSYSGDGAAATLCAFNNPSALAYDGSNKLYVADRGNQRIRVINLSTGIISLFAGSGGSGFSGDGGPATAAQLLLPEALSVGPTGNVYISDRNNHRIRMVDGSGIITTVAGNGTGTFAGDGTSATGASINNPVGVTLNTAGDLLIGDCNNNRIRKVLLSSTSSTCNNIDFETGDISGWSLKSGDILGVVLPCDTCAKIAGGTSTIVNSSTSIPGICRNGIDTMGNFPVISPGSGNYALLLNNKSSGAKIQELKQTIAVTSANAYISYKFAAVLQNGYHPVTDQAYFNVEVLDQSGTIVACTKYYASISSAGVGTGWLPSPVDTSARYIPWQTVFMNLTPYIGTTITLKFIVSDCNQGGHYGYAYVDAICGSSSPFTVNYPPGCGNFPITLTAPGGGFTYTWAGPGIIGSTTAQTTTVNASGTYSVTLKNLNDTNCSFTLSSPVAPIAVKPTANYTVIKPCSNGATFSDQSTNNPTSWKWRFGDGTTSNFQNPTHVFASAGTYTVTLIATNSCGSDSLKTNVTISPSPTVSISSYTICSGTPTTLSASATGGSTFSWSPATGLSSTSTQSVTATVTATVIYTVTATNTVGCSANATSSVSVSSPTITASISTSSVTCPGACTGAATANITSGLGAYTYSWSTGGTTNAISSRCAGTYTVNINNTTCGTSATFTANIGTPPAIVLTQTVVGSSCASNGNGSIAVGASGGNGSPYTYSFNAGTYSTTTTFSNLTSGAYTVAVKDKNGCIKTNIITVPQTASNGPSVYVTSDTVCAGTAVTINATGNAVSYTWAPATFLNITSGPTVVSTPTASITYLVTGIDAAGCISNVNSFLVVSSTYTTYPSGKSVCVVPNTEITVYNSFSPNGDGLNDVFEIDNIDLYTPNHVYIYNRWGQLLWDREGYDNKTVAWDGKDSKGNILAPGTYFYLIEVNGQKTRKHWLELTK